MKTQSLEGNRYLGHEFDVLRLKVRENMKLSVGSAVPLATRLPLKIFQIGFNKCGTKTLHHYFSGNGIKSVHWDEGRLAQRMFANLANGKSLIAGYEQFDVFTDMEYLNESGTYLEAYKLFSHLASQYPNALFILNTRDREGWIRSRLEHGKSLSYAQRSMLHYNVTSIHDLADRWRIEWERHHRQVTEFFASKPHRFLVCRIETDLPHILNEALPECKLDSAYYRLKGKKKSSQRGWVLPAAMHAAGKFRSLIGITPLNWRRPYGQAKPSSRLVQGNLSPFGVGQNREAGNSYAKGMKKTSGMNSDLGGFKKMRLRYSLDWHE